MAWYSRLVNMIRSTRHSHDLDREMEFHLHERADDLRAAGMADADAAAEARRRFGNRTAQKERAHDADIFTWLESLASDVRYALRALVASPGFALVAILSLALGIGANTAIFSLTNALVFKSLPISHPEQLVALNMGSPDNDEFTNPLWEQIRDHATVFSGAFAYAGHRYNLSPAGEVRYVNGAEVSGDAFRTLGIHAAAGRLIQPSDDVRGCPGVAVVSTGFAQRQFGSAANAVGQTLSLNGHPFPVAGVVPAGFDGMEVGLNAEIYTPLCGEAIFEGPTVLDIRSRWYLRLFARPKPGLSTAQVNAALAVAAPGIFKATLPEHWGADSKTEYLKRTLGALPSPTGISGARSNYQAALYFLLAAVGVVLLIACANIANLLMARGAARQREISIRLAIGAGRRRVVRQLLTESALLALIGAALGVLFARWAARSLVGVISVRGEPLALDVGLDGRVLAFTVGVAVLTALLFGLLPAWRATRVDPQAAMKSGGRGIVSGDTRYRAGRALVVGQVALSLGLVTVAALLLGSFRKLVTQNTGFDSRGVLLVDMNFSRLTAGKDSASALLLNYQDQMVRNLRQAPGVAAAAAAFITPTSGTSWNDFVVIPGYPPPDGKLPMSYFNQVSDGYFSTMRTPLLMGRVFTEADTRPGAPNVAVLNQAAVDQLFHGENPIGHTYHTKFGDTDGPSTEIIGVVATEKYASLSEKPTATIYVPLGQGGFNPAVISYVVRGAGNSGALVPAIKATAARMSPSISLEFRSLDDQIEDSLTRPRLLATLSGFFGAIALLLAVIGLYGTMSYTVTRRRNEIGIRMALGAAGPSVVQMIVGEAGKLVAIGLAGGLLLALATTRYVGSFLYGMTPTDPFTITLSVLVLGAVAIGAALRPAWRASRVDPMDALREE
ncbi:MAG TPA: ABC transporter permease [Gemmatimonadaceae bacterium]|nr:ABC transporter permease [Gemmatimonadaceae bacterium]